MAEKLYIVFLTTDIQATVEITPQEYVNKRLAECSNACAEHSIGFQVCRDLCEAEAYIRNAFLENTRPCVIAINQDADTFGNFYDNTRNLYVTPTVFWDGAGAWSGLKKIVDNEGKDFRWPIHILAAQPNGEKFVTSLYQLKNISPKLELICGGLSTAIKDIIEEIE